MTAPAPLLTHRLEGEAGRDTVLLLNGGLMSYGAWVPTVAPLGGAYRLLFCDLRGQLLSPGPSHPDLAGHVADVVALLDDLDLARVHVIGTSFGAEVGLLLAGTHPERVASLIAVTATDYVTPTILQGVEDMRRLAADVAAGGEPGLLHDRVVEEAYSPAYIDAHREELAQRREQIAGLPDAWFIGLGGLLTATEQFDLRPILGSIHCPALVVIAGLDALMPREQSLALAEAIAGAEVAEHPTSGHALVAEDPDWLGRTCLAFLDRVSSPSTDRSTS